jgi:DeoR family transcriptional regulator of aga operon
VETVSDPINDRQEKILEFLADNTSASVAELSRHMQVSEVTIRSDLSFLQNSRRVERLRGRARLVDERMRQEYSFAMRQQLNADKKQKIGKLAATLINPLDSILLDSSTTAVAVARQLREREDLKDLTVVPTGLWTAIEALAVPDINVLLAGGHVRHTTGSITGLPACEFLRSFNFHKAFLGAWGITAEEGACDAHLLEVELKRCIVRSAQQVILVVDGSKFGRRALASYAALEQIHTIITDDSAPADLLQILQKRGVEVLVAE